MRVALIPTGDLELIGLPRALANLFGGEHEFYSLRDSGGRPFGSVGPPLTKATSIPTNADKLVARMVAELVPGRDGKPADHVVVLDDVELDDQRDPAAIVGEFRRATRAYLERQSRERPRLAERATFALRRSASFHLAMPMIEAWLFADPDGPRKAGVPPDRLPANWRTMGDPERFVTDDPDYAKDAGECCSGWRALPPGSKKAHTPSWLRTGADRTRHPKRFLAWLCRSPEEKNCTTYRETHGGADALAALDWSAALGRSDHCTYLRALVDDLADALDQRPRPLTGGGHCAALTARHTSRRDPVLRNL